MTQLLRSRAEIDQQPRTAQFEIKRLCPHLFPNGDPEIESLFPVSVWVILGISRPRDPSCSCDGKTYAVVRQEAVNIRKRVNLETRGDKHVCEHMGQVIE